jgi:hypothetical protein
MPDAEVVPDLQPFGEEPNGASNRRRPCILSNNATGAPAHEAGGFFRKVRSSAWEAGVLLNCEHLLSEQKVKVKRDSSYSFQFNEMARPAGLEPARFCLEGRRSHM